MHLRHFGQRRSRQAGTIRPAPANRRKGNDDQNVVFTLIPPQFLVDALAIDGWNRIAQHIRPDALHVPVYRTLLAGYCTSIAKAVRAEMIIAKEGRYYTTQGRQGVIMRRRHPAVQDAEEAWISARRFAKQLGLLDMHANSPLRNSGRRSIFK
jgi:phage terminase small subunit